MRKLTLLRGRISSILFPSPCAICGKKQTYKKEAVCLKCSYELPVTNYHLQPENEFTDRLWGRVPLLFGAAAYFFTKKGLTQKLIHQFKYKNRRDIGLLIGQSYGIKLLKSEIFRSVERIIPVPLHPLKERKRGFNQSTVFAQGISNVTGIPIEKNVLKRISNNSSQTQKGNIERLSNVEGVFKLNNKQNVSGKHVLIVDDVMTTGATLEACAQPLMHLKNTRISMITMAIATT